MSRPLIYPFMRKAAIGVSLLALTVSSILPSASVTASVPAAQTTAAAPSAITAQQKAQICGIKIPQYESNGWRFVINFDADLPIGCMISPVISQLGLSNYQQTLVPCEVVGDVLISGGTAKFNGGYIRCDNFNPPDSGVKAVSYFDIHTWVKNVGNQSAANNNPVFYHPDVSLHIPKTTNRLGEKLFGLTTRRGAGNITTSPRTVTALNNGWYWFASQRFDVGLAHTLGSAAYPLTLPGIAVSPFMFNHSPQTIYIGYQPGANGATFYGEMDEITIDPQFGGDG